MSGFPDLQTILSSWWGSAYIGPEFTSTVINTAGSFGLNENPTFGFADLLAFFPKFFGTPVTAVLTTTLGSTAALLSAAVPNLAVGDLLVLNGTLAASTTIAAMSDDGLSLTLSQNALATVTAKNAMAFPSPLVPYSVILLYMQNAQASLSYETYDVRWSEAMCLFVAHYLTLWLQSEGSPQTMQGQAAVAGLQRGIAISKSVDGVSISYQPLTQGSEVWTSMQATGYGAQLITLARQQGSRALAYYQ